MLRLRLSKQTEYEKIRREVKVGPKLKITFLHQPNIPCRNIFVGTFWPKRIILKNSMLSTISITQDQRSTEGGRLSF